MFCHGAQYAEGEIEEGVVVRPDWFELSCFAVEVGESVTRTGDDAKELRETKDEIDELGDEQKKEELCVVALDSSDAESHSSEISEGITDENRGRIPVKIEQTEGCVDEREKKEKSFLMSARDITT